MAVLLSPVGGAAAQFFTNAGVPLSGGKIYTYAAGTSTPQATYTTSLGNIQHSNPIILDAAGRVPTGEIWLSDAFSYKFVLKDANDVLIATYDNIVGINSNFINYVNQQEIQTATAGQTVFNLTTMQYQPGIGNLSVFVDGVNQYGPGAQYAYTETDSDTVTFVSGIHVGAEVKFTSTQIQNSGVADASQITYTYPAANAVQESVEERLAQYVSVKDFGAVGDGVTDDTVAIQNAIDACNGELQFTNGNYLISSSLIIDENSTCKSLCIPAGTKISVNGSTSAITVEGTLKGSTTLSASPALGATSFSVANASSFVIGDYIWLFYTSTYNQVDVGVVTNVSGTTVTIDTPLSYAWNHLTGVTVQSVTPVKNVKIYGGGRIENLTATNSDNLVKFFYAWDCSCEGMELAQKQGTSRPLLFGSQATVGTAYCKAIQNKVTEASENGIETYVRTFATQISDNVIEKAGSNSIGHGIAIRGAKHIVSNNVVKRALYDGISVGSAADIIVEGNQVSGATVVGYAGIAVTTGSVLNVVVNSNRCFGNSYGLRIYDNSPSGNENIVVSGNSFIGNITGPMYVVAGFATTFNGNQPTNKKSYCPTTATSGTSETSLFNYTVPAYTMGQAGGLRIKSRVAVIGTANSKTIRVVFGGTTLFTSTQASGVSGFHDIDLTIIGIGDFSGKRASWTTLSGTSAIATNNGNAISEPSTVNRDLVIFGQCGSGADSMTVYTVEIEPFGQTI